MPKPYSDDLRGRAIAIVEGGASRHEVAGLFEVSPSTVINWLRRWRDDGSSAAKPSGGSVSPLEEHASWLLALIAEQPDLTLDEAVAAMRKRRIVGSRSALSRFFIRHDITFKKKACAPQSRLGPTSHARDDAGFENKACLTQRGWCLSTRPLPAPRWCGSTADVHGEFD
jgi:transposase